jgi:hypothetical protein
MKIVKSLTIAAIILLSGYTIIGTSERVEEIKARAPLEMGQRNWTILRYEGFQYGSWDTHGGKCWYHVANTDNRSIQYRVSVSLWGDELQYYYTSPEKLQRFDVNIKD